jgi:hypothetical protein
VQPQAEACQCQEAGWQATVLGFRRIAVRVPLRGAAPPIGIRMLDEAGRQTEGEMI